MKEEKKGAPIGTLWEWGKPYYGKFIVSVILAVLGVVCRMEYVIIEESFQKLKELVYSQKEAMEAAEA